MTETTPPAPEHPRNITAVEMVVSMEKRWQLMGQRGCVIWFTGLSGSGKSTLAKAVDAALHERGLHSFVLDGDNLRHGLCSDLGFDDASRLENLRRAGETARLMAEAGLIVICAFISPFAAQRAQIRSRCEGAGIRFFEVYVDAPLAVCERRDPKGLYKKAREGRLPSFTGIDSVYEPPAAPDLDLHTDEHSIEESATLLLDCVLAGCEPPAQA